MEPIISIAHFKMQFGKTEVIKNLSFEVKRGETFGFLGSNGSGKTTTIRALLGIYQPTAGELLVGGKPYSVSSGIKLGYLPEERGLYKKEPVIDIRNWAARTRICPPRAPPTIRPLTMPMRSTLRDRKSVV